MQWEQYWLLEVMLVLMLVEGAVFAVGENWRRREVGL
jgi:hypothetical protein